MVKKLVFLKTEEDFSNFKKSRKLVSANFSFRWYKHTNQNIPRFGFIVPKKTIKNVTDRNKIKRRLKAILQKHIEGIKPLDILFFPKPDTIKLRFSELEQELIGSFKKVGLYVADTAKN